jgi:hypothetical protein
MNKLQTLAETQLYDSPNEYSKEIFVRLITLWEAAMQPNRKEPESAPFWSQSLSAEGRPHGSLLQFAAEVQ